MLNKMLKTNRLEKMTYRFLALLFVILIVTNLIYLVHSSKHPLRPIQNYTNNQQQNRGLSDKKVILNLFCLFFYVILTKT